MARITDADVKRGMSLALTTLVPGFLAQLAMRIASNVPAESSEKMAWLGMPGSYGEQNGKATWQEPPQYSYAITNKKWVNRALLPLDLVNNDKVAEVQRFIADFYATLPLLWEEIVASLINGSEATACYDGQFFVDDDHTIGKQSAWSNDLAPSASTAAAITAEEAAVGLNQVIEAMKAFPDEQGRNIANRGMSEVTVLMAAGGVNAATMRAAIGSENVDTGSGSITNPLRGQDVTINFRTDGLITLADTKFVVLRADAGGRSMVLQENAAERMSGVLTSDDFKVANEGLGLHGRWVGNGGYGLPQHAALGTFT